MLKEALPEDPLVAEEDSHVLQKPEERERLTAVTEFVQRIFPDEDEETVCSHIDVGRAEPSLRYWTLDPIDGTKGYLRGGQYVVALALIENGQVKLGALGCPNLSVD
jgi:3'(2'), 5'-bisphosphate nucleotidase